MGIANTSSLLYVIKGLSIKSIKSIINEVYYQNPNQATSSSSNCTNVDHSKKYYVDVDCNWVACNLGGTKSPSEAASITCDFLVTIANYGFVVTPICDGECRHHSKRATIDRIAKREKSKLKAIDERFKLLSVSQQLVQTNSNLTPDQKKKLESEREALSKRIKTLEKKNNSTQRLDSSFALDLEHVLQTRGCHDENDNFGVVTKVKVGLFQADALLARRAVEGKSHFIISSDTDFFVLVGLPCLLIRKFHFSRGRGSQQQNNIDLMKLKDFEVAVSNLKMKEDILQALDEKSLKQAKVRDAKFPLFAESNLFLRVSIAVVLGCDVFVGGINGISVSKVSDKITEICDELKKQGVDIEDDEQKNKVIGQFQKWACENGKITQTLFETFVTALIYEPANEVSTKGNIIFEEEDTTAEERVFSHVHSRTEQAPALSPEVLPPYLEDFSFSNFNEKETNPPDGIINVDESLFYCVGPTTSRTCKESCHLVLKEEPGVIQCSRCKKFVCKSCNEQGKCLPCYASEIIAPESEDTPDNMSPGVSSSTNTPISINEMRQTLERAEFELDASAMPDEIEEIFESYIMLKKLSSIADDHVDNVPFPVFPASAIDKITDQNDTTFKVISSFDFSEGGQFIANQEDLPDNLLPSLLELLGTFVEYNLRLKNIPSLITRFTRLFHLFLLILLISLVKPLVFAC